MFSGPRLYLDRLLPVQLDAGFAGHMFKSRNIIAELSWGHLSYKGIGNWPGPTRDRLEEFRNYWSNTLSNVNVEQMPEIFDGWPRNAIEEWATDYNYGFYLRYDVFYSASSLESVVVVNGFGLSSLDWREYQESYLEAQTMHKLKENI